MVSDGGEGSKSVGWSEGNEGDNTPSLINIATIMTSDSFN